MNIRLPSNNVEYYKEAITSNDPDKVREIQKTFANLTPEEQNIIQALIDEVIWSAKTPMKDALGDLRNVMNMYDRMEWWTILLSNDWLRDGEWMYEVEDFPWVSDRKNVTLAWWHNVSSFWPVWAWNETLVWHAGNDTLPGTVRSLTSPKLPEIWADRNKAFALATKTFWVTPTRDALRIYQKEQKLKSIDGVIWKETYSEMYAAVVLEKANDRIDEFGISEKTQKEILWVLSNGNPNGKNVMILRAFLKSQHDTFKTKSDYDTKYKSFYASINTYETTTLATHESKAAAKEVEVELHKVDKDGRSMYRRIKDGIDKGNIGEEMASLIRDKWPMALFLLAWAFVFGMIPWMSDSVTTNTWWKRLLVGWVIIANKESLMDMGSDLFKGSKNWLDKNQSSWSAITKVTETQRIQGSKLREIFPNDDIFDGIQEYFKNSEVISSLDSSKYPEYATALRSWKNIPSFFKDISINGQKLSNEQIATYLEALYEWKNEWDKNFLDLTVLETVAWVSTWVLGVTLLSVAKKWPPARLAFLGLAAWTSLLTYLKWEEILEKIQNMPWFNWLNKKEDDILKQINNNSLREKATEIIKSEAETTEKITKLKWILSSDNKQLKGLIDLLIGTEVRVFELSTNTRFAAIDSLWWVFPGEVSIIEWMLSEVEKLEWLVSSNMTSPEEKAKLAQILTEFKPRFEKYIADKNAYVVKQEAANYGPKIRKEVSDIDWSITAATASITTLKEEKDKLISDRLSAKATEIEAINRKIAEIPGKIAEKQSIIDTLQPQLIIAQRNVWNLEVENAWAVVDAHLSYINNTIPTAIEAQWIISTVNTNILEIKIIDEKVNEIIEAIAPAEDNQAKRDIIVKLQQVLNWLKDIWDSYKAKLEEGTSVTPEKLKSQDLDFTDKDTVKWIKEILASESKNSANANALEFFSISPKEATKAIDIYRWEFVRQLDENKADILSTPATEIYVLKQKIENRTTLLWAYSSLFESEYEDTNFEDVLKTKWLEVLEKSYSDVMFTESISWGQLVNRYLAQIPSPNKEFIANQLKAQNTIENLMDTLAALSVDWIEITLKDGTKSSITPDTVRESSELLDTLKTELNFLTA